jgi:hypothetical protein
MDACGGRRMERTMPQPHPRGGVDGRSRAPPARPGGRGAVSWRCRASTHRCRRSTAA